MAFGFNERESERTEAFDINTIDLNSEAVRKDLLAKWVGENVTVRRSSGAIEAGWFVGEVHPNGIVVKDVSRGIDKTITLTDLVELNPRLIEEL